MKIIGIVSSGTEQNHRPLFILPELVAKEVARAGALPIILPYLEAPDETVYDYLDGIVLLGGNDVLPFYYGEDPEPEAGPYDMKRDQYEIDLVHEAQKRKIPLLGIGRGMQVINVALGGSLNQSIVSKILHHRPEGTKKDPFHRIQILPSRLSKIFGDELIVNSYHSQSIKSLGRGLTVSARSIDGVVEAIEGQDILGVQFQPEFFQHNENFILLFRDFVESL
ncbi:MAG: gamma-glutamyl-gamma-aminobutyrate hydrolase family protein [Tissierellia bacterium]|nr:gamma-glutamyl-gamma-aminobutyrate hydrolase family protein [Tissierellia bacterium]